DYKLMLISIALAFLSLVIINLAASLIIFHTLVPGLLTNVIVDMLWLFLISFMLYALVRFINDRSADLRLLHDLGQELVGMPAAGDAPGLFAAVVRKVASHFPYSHISIFLSKKGGALECVASSSPEGQLLVREGFTLTPGDGNKIGIVGRAIETGATYFS